MITILMQLGLFFWFILSLWLVYNDSTLSPTLKIIGEVINVASLIYILLNMLNIANANTMSTIIYFALGISLLIWYLYFITQDFNNGGYSPAEKYIYVSIDITMILYLISSMIFTLFHQYINNRYSIIEQLYQLQSLNLNWI